MRVMVFLTILSLIIGYFCTLLPIGVSTLDKNDGWNYSPVRCITAHHKSC